MSWQYIGIPSFYIELYQYLQLQLSKSCSVTKLGPHSFKPHSFKPHSFKPCERLLNRLMPRGGFNTYGKWLPFVHWCSCRKLSKSSTLAQKAVSHMQPDDQWHPKNNLTQHRQEDIMHMHMGVSKTWSLQIGAPQIPKWMRSRRSHMIFQDENGWNL